MQVLAGPRGKTDSLNYYCERTQPTHSFSRKSYLEPKPFRQPADRVAHEQLHQHDRRVGQLQPALRAGQQHPLGGTRRLLLWSRIVTGNTGATGSRGKQRPLLERQARARVLPHAPSSQEAGPARGPDTARGHRPEEGAVAKQASPPPPALRAPQPGAASTSCPEAGERLPGAPESRACGASSGGRSAGHGCRPGPAR